MTHCTEIAALIWPAISKEQIVSSSWMVDGVRIELTHPTDGRRYSIEIRPVPESKGDTK